MRASDAERWNYMCPECRGELSQDASGKGYVRHLHRKTDGTLCAFGMGERDESSVPENGR